MYAASTSPCIPRLWPRPSTNCNYRTIQKLRCWYTTKPCIAYSRNK